MHAWTELSIGREPSVANYISILIEAMAAIEEKTMAKIENGRVVETSREARGAERGPTVRNVLIAGTGLVIAAFVVVYIVYFGGGQ
ncbi:hypothetical protein NB311A_20201 [Nitrobacter sp. Nb-311A]|nr:hypothetical protein NB311A_20201 [Nitrobacter sp. Nb-311A]